MLTRTCVRCQEANYRHFLKDRPKKGSCSPTSRTRQGNVRMQQTALCPGLTLALTKSEAQNAGVLENARAAMKER